MCCGIKVYMKIISQMLLLKDLISNSILILEETTFYAGLSLR